MYTIKSYFRLQLSFALPQGQNWGCLLPLEGRERFSNLNVQESQYVATWEVPGQVGLVNTQGNADGEVQTTLDAMCLLVSNLILSHCARFLNSELIPFFYFYLSLLCGEGKLQSGS